MSYTTDLTSTLLSKTVSYCSFAELRFPKEEKQEKSQERKWIQLNNDISMDITEISAPFHKHESGAHSKEEK